MVKNAKRICVAICFGYSNNLTGLLRKNAIILCMNYPYFMSTSHCVSERYSCKPILCIGLHTHDLNLDRSTVL